MSARMPLLSRFSALLSSFHSPPSSRCSILSLFSPFYVFRLVRTSDVLIVLFVYVPLAYQSFRCFSFRICITVFLAKIVLPVSFPSAYLSLLLPPIAIPSVFFLLAVAFIYVTLIFFFNRWVDNTLHIPFSSCYVLPSYTFPSTCLLFLSPRTYSVSLSPFFNLRAPRILHLGLFLDHSHVDRIPLIIKNLYVRSNEDEVEIWKFKDHEI